MSGKGYRYPIPQGPRNERTLVPRLLSGLEVTSGSSTVSADLASAGVAASSLISGVIAGVVLSIAAVASTSLQAAALNQAEVASAAVAATSLESGLVSGGVLDSQASASTSLDGYQFSVTSADAAMAGAAATSLDAAATIAGVAAADGQATVTGVSSAIAGSVVNSQGVAAFTGTGAWFALTELSSSGQAALTGLAGEMRLAELASAGQASFTGYAAYQYQTELNVSAGASTSLEGQEVTGGAASETDLNAVAGASTSLQADTNARVIAGRVYDCYGDPVASAVVDLFLASSDAFLATDTADANGDYSFLYFGYGPFYLRAVNPGGTLAGTTPNLDGVPY